MIRPLRDFVLVSPDPAPEISGGGIHIPETAQENLRTGTVKAAGPGRYYRASDGELHLQAPEFEPGDRVAWKHGPTVLHLEIGGDPVYLARMTDIHAVVFG